MLVFLLTVSGERDQSLWTEVLSYMPQIELVNPVQYTQLYTCIESLSKEIDCVETLKQLEAEYEAKPPALEAEEESKKLL